MLPNFLIVGAQKAATSWLARGLDKHPDVFVPEWEIHFFNHRFSRGLEWYKHQFRDWSGERLIGEKSPGYLNHPEAPTRIQATLGDSTKLIASLRHPVERAYSAFWQYIKHERIPADSDFRTVFLEDDRFELHDRGCYHTHLERYLETFPRENLHVLIYEELRRDNEAAIKQCVDFLGVDPARLERTAFATGNSDTRVNSGRELRRFHSRAVALRRYIADKMTILPRNIRQPFMEVGRAAFEHLLRRLPEQRTYSRLNPHLRQELLQDFMPQIERLEQTLGRDLSIWYAPVPQVAPTAHAETNQNA